MDGSLLRSKKNVKWERDKNELLHNTMKYFMKKEHSK